MKRGLLTLVGIVVLGVSAYLATSHWMAPSSASGWLCREYGLGPANEEKLKELQRDYGSRCGPYCASMCEANGRLEKLVLDSSSVTPELRAAIAETDRIRTETRISMLEHIYSVASQLPPEKRRDYLLRVLPRLTDSCGNR
jgi:hypothetical protein